MRRIVWLLLALCLLVGCQPAKEAPAPTESAATAENVIPQDLPGSWTSVERGGSGRSETITFYDTGKVSVTTAPQENDIRTIYGTFTVAENTLTCSFTEGDLSAPFQRSYSFRIDGRELILTDGAGDVQYLRVS